MHSGKLVLSTNAKQDVQYNPAIRLLTTTEMRTCGPQRQIRISINNTINKL